MSGKWVPDRHRHTTSTEWRYQEDGPGLGCIVMIILFLIFCACCNKSKGEERTTAPDVRVQGSRSECIQANPDDALILPKEAIHENSFS